MTERSSRVVVCAEDDELVGMSSPLEGADDIRVEALIMLVENALDSWPGLLLDSRLDPLGSLRAARREAVPCAPARLAVFASQVPDIRLDLRRVDVGNERIDERAVVQLAERRIQPRWGSIGCLSAGKRQPVRRDGDEDGRRGEEVVCDGKEGARDGEEGRVSRAGAMQQVRALEGGDVVQLSSVASLRGREQDALGQGGSTDGRGGSLLCCSLSIDAIHEVSKLVHPAGYACSSAGTPADGESGPLDVQYGIVAGLATR